VKLQSLYQTDNTNKIAIIVIDCSRQLLVPGTQLSILQPVGR